MANTINWGKIYEKTAWGIGIINNISWGKIYANLAGSIPSFALDFANIANDFTFTRSSFATRVNEFGLIETVTDLGSELVQNGDFEELGSELVTNGDFSNGLTGWNNNATYPVDSLSVVDGRLELENINGVTQVFTSDGFSVTANKTYKISLDTIKESGADDFDITLRNIPLGTTIETITTTQQTGELIYYFNSASTQNLVIQFTLRDTIKGSIDNVSVKQVNPNDDWSLGTGWSIEDGKATHTGASSYIQQSNVYTIGKKYRVSLEIVDYTSGLITLPFDANGGNIQYVSGVGIYTSEFTMNSSTCSIYANSFEGSIDNISVQEVFEDDVPRIDYSTGEGAFLLEPQSTNLIDYSEDFSQSIWSKNDVLIEDGHTAPDGSNTAYKVTENGSQAHLVILGGSISPVNKHKSIWARTVSGTGTIQLLNHNTDTGNIFTLTTQWQRFDLAHASLNHFYAVDFRGTSTLTEVVLWGAQLEELPYATSYIPTNGSIATRSAETCVDATPTINSEEGVLFVEIKANNTEPKSSDEGISVYGVTDSISIRFHRDGGNEMQFVVVSNGSIQVNERGDVGVDLLEYNKIAIKWKLNDYKIFINGSEFYSQTNFNPPQNLYELDFEILGNNPFYGNTKDLKIYDKALTDDELITLTTI